MTARTSTDRDAGDVTLAAAMADGTVRLANAGVSTPAVDARWLVAAACGHDPRRAPDRPLGTEAAARLATMLGRREAREPLQLIVGSTAFRSLELTCAPGVFIPRPETEILAGLAIDLARRALDAVGSAIVVEPCCGTGAVSLALAVEVADAQVYASDLSAHAVALARRNLARLRADGLVIASAVSVAEGDLLAAIDVTLRGRVDVLVANPPYLPLADGPSLPREVIDHDPHAALFGGHDGHEVVDALLAAAPDWLVPGGAVLLEIDVRRGEEALALAADVGLVDLRLELDLAGAPRFLVAHRAPDARPRR
jgi:release factor glutamine methyltransferase